MNFLIMHGSYGSPDENWFRWLEKELISRNHSVILEQFPSDDWDTINKLGIESRDSYHPNQTLSSWRDYFSEHILPKIIHEETSFIGHSLAPVFMLHMIEEFEFRLSKAVFVSPFFDIPDRKEIWQFYPVNKTFYSANFDFENIRSRIAKSHVVYGDDDPYVPSTEPPLFAKKLSSELHIVKGGKHCGGNFTEFPLILDLAL